MVPKSHRIACILWIMDERERERERERELISTFTRWIYDSTLHRNFIYERRKIVKIDSHTFQFVCNKLNFHFHFPMKLSFSSCWFIFLFCVFNLYENGRWIFDRIIIYTAMKYETISSNFSNLLSRYLSKIQPSFLPLQTTKSNPTLFPLFFVVVVVVVVGANNYILLITAYL